MFMIVDSLPKWAEIIDLSLLFLSCYPKTFVI